VSKNLNDELNRLIDIVKSDGVVERATRIYYDYLDEKGTYAHVLALGIHLIVMGLAGIKELCIDEIGDSDKCGSGVRVYYQMIIKHIVDKAVENL